MSRPTLAALPVAVVIGDGGAVLLTLRTLITLRTLRTLRTLLTRLGGTRQLQGYAAASGRGSGAAHALAGTLTVFLERS